MEPDLLDMLLKFVSRLQRNLTFQGTSKRQFLNSSLGELIGSWTFKKKSALVSKYSFDLWKTITESGPAKKQETDIYQDVREN